LAGRVIVSIIPGERPVVIGKNEDFGYEKRRVYLTI
jgi:hypothetical protein